MNIADQDEDQTKHICELLDRFREAPFTCQRISELVMEPCANKQSLGWKRIYWLHPPVSVRLNLMTIDPKLHLLENITFDTLRNLDEHADLTLFQDDQECFPSNIEFPRIAEIESSQIIFKNILEQKPGLTLHDILSQKVAYSSPMINSIPTDVQNLTNGTLNYISGQEIQRDSVGLSGIKSNLNSNLSDQMQPDVEMKVCNQQIVSVTKNTLHTPGETDSDKSAKERITIKLPSINANILNTTANLICDVVNACEISIPQIQQLEKSLSKLLPDKMMDLISNLSDVTHSTDNLELCSFMKVLSGTISEGETKAIFESQDFVGDTTAAVKALGCINLKLLFITLELTMANSKKRFCTLGDITKIISSTKTLFNNTLKSFFSMEAKAKHHKSFVVIVGGLLSTIILNFIELCQLYVLDEDIIITLIYLSIDICLVADVNVLNDNGLFLVSNRGASLLGTIFASNEQHQLFIMEELVSHFPRLNSAPASIPLQTGKSIHFYSYIVFQILQSGLNSHKVEKSIPNSLQELDTRLQFSETLPMISTFKKGFECISKASFHFFQYLVKKAADSTKEVKGKSSTEQEYKMVLDGLLKDLLLTYISPEWPVAEVFAQQCVRMMLQTLEDQKKNENLFRAISTDWLGDFAEVLLKEPASKDLKTAFATLSNPISSSSVEQLSIYFKSILNWVSALPVISSFKKNVLVYHLSSVINKIAVTSDGADKTMIKDALVNILNEFDSAQNNSSTTELNVDIFAMYQLYLKSCNCFKMIDRIILTLLKGIDLASITVRTKSIRCFSDLLNSSSIPKNTQTAILHAVQNRLVDSSPTVRDAAMDVCSRYIQSQDEDQVLAMYPLLASRSTDLSIAVRKRVVKLLKELHCKYFRSQKMSKILGDTLSRLFARLQDEETTVSDLATKLLNDVYYPASDVYSSRDGLSNDFEILVGILANQLGKCGATLNMFNTYLFYLNKTKNENIIRQTERIIATLFSLVIKNQELEAVFITIHQFSLFFKELCTEHISALLPFIKPKNNSDAEIRQTHQVLMILNTCFSDIKFNDTLLVRNIETDLLSVLGQGSLAILRHSIPCLCKIIQFQTQSFSKIVQVIQKCFEVLKKYQAEDVLQLSQKISATILRCLVIVSLIVGHLDFINTETAKTVDYSCVELQNVTRGRNLIEMSFDLISTYNLKYIDHDSGSISFTALCSYMKARPKYFLVPGSMQIIKNVLQSTKTMFQIEFLNTLVEFLTEQQLEKSFDLKQPSLDEDVKIKILVGNAESFVEDGIPSSLVQTYLPNIIEIMMHTNLKVSKVAFKAVSLALEHGLVHPIVCVPGITALESCSDPTIREQAVFIHKKLHEKYSSFIHTKNLESINCLYGYQKNAASANNSGAIQSHFENENVKISFISPLYGLIKEKRSRRNEFLRTIVNVYNLTAPDVAKEYSYYKFIGECIAYIDFQTVEEVMHVVYHINVLLSFGANAVSQALKGLSSSDERPEGIYNFILDLTAQALFYGIFEEIHDDNPDIEDYEDSNLAKEGKRQRSEPATKKKKRKKTV
ncbi:Sister chromatid cohesion protein 2 [Terramyces sp. JEL0728]|nr:Sister chromatid cohesion protein 2 [Terramyces sp. JEL0728]